MKQRGNLVVLGLLLLTITFAWAAPGTSTVLTTHRVYGRDYVLLADVMSVFGLKVQSLPNRTYLLDSPKSRVMLALDSREAQVQGVKHWLSAPPAAQRGQVWLPALDVVKTFDPLLRHSGLLATNALRTIVLDAGHGGDDRGASSRSGLIEKQLTLDVAYRLGLILESQGYRVLFTRRDDRRVPLEDRSTFARLNKADLFVSIHFNSAQPASLPCGAETFCLTPAGSRSTSSKTESLTQTDFIPLNSNRFDNDNVLVAHHIQSELVSKAGATERGVKRARFEVLKDLNCPGVLVECGFLSNPAETKRIMQASYRQQLAAGIACGIANYRKAVNR